MESVSALVNLRRRFGSFFPPLNSAEARVPDVTRLLPVLQDASSNKMVDQPARSGGLTGAAGPAWKQPGPQQVAPKRVEFRGGPLEMASGVRGRASHVHQRAFAITDIYLQLICINKCTCVTLDI